MKIIFDAGWLADERIQERERRGSKPKIDCNFMFFEILNNNNNRNKNTTKKKRNEMWKNKRRRRFLKIQLLRIFLIQRLKRRRSTLS